MQTTQRDIMILAGKAKLAAILGIPDKTLGMIIFAHGSGSSRHSMRNQFVARTLELAGFATLLLDLLTPEEEEYDRETSLLRFDAQFLAERLGAAMDWSLANAETKKLRIGLFGASTGAAATLIAAAQRPKDVRAIVSRGGRPDLAGPALPLVLAPTLLIVGGHDEPVVELNRAAAQKLNAEHEVIVIAGATHLFEEPGALERVAELARAWFLRYLPAGTT